MLKRRRQNSKGFGGSIYWAKALINQIQIINHSDSRFVNNLPPTVSGANLLLYWAHTLGDPGLADDIGGRFDHVLVDEYQDTNRLQAAIILALKPGGQGLTVVGDDAQSIYSFRAATVRNILDFPVQFTPPAEIITLERNYRSTQAILAAANGLIGLGRERFTKNFWTDRNSTARPLLVSVRDEADQARYIADCVLENRESGSALKQQAVLFRTSHHCGPLEV